MELRADLGALPAASTSSATSNGGIVDLLSSSDEEGGNSSGPPLHRPQAQQPSQLQAPLRPAPAVTEPEAAAEAVERAAAKDMPSIRLEGPSDASEAAAVLVEDDDSLRDDEDESATGVGAEGESGAEEGDDLAWEMESAIDDMIEEMTNDEDSAVEVRHVPESTALIKQLHDLGPHDFVAENLESEKYTAKQLCLAFGFRVPEMLNELPEDTDVFYKILGTLLQRELKKRQKLPQYNTIDDAVSLLQSAKNILVLTGAGISTSLGIPDFRSANGLYAQLEKNGLADRVDDPQDVFSLHVFRDDPSIFYSVAREILSPAHQRFSPTHAFIRLLQDKGKLLTNFTQNIDNLEAYAGILPENLIHCHGSFASATCQRCGEQVDGKSIYPEILAGDVPRCKACLAQLAHLRVAAGNGGAGMKRKRGSNASHRSVKNRGREPWADSSGSSEASDDDELSDEAAGVMKPDIVFFGEDLPDAFHDRLIRHDKERVDLVLVMGTSLKVAPVSEIPAFLPPHVPQIYVSRDPCGHINFDIDILGDCDAVVAELCRRAGWDLNHEMLLPPPSPAGAPGRGGAVEVELVEGFASRHRVRLRRDAGGADDVTSST